MGDIELTIREFYLYVIIGGAILGALLGLIPLILGRRRNHTRLGWYGLIASTVAGGIAPLLSVIVTAIFIWLIVRKTDTKASSPTDDDNGQTSASE